jgi:putative phosphoesterase
MRFAIVSDTHSNVSNFKKAVKWINQEKIGLILHCGDIGDPESLKESLVEFKGQFLGVLGNMDRDFKLDLEKYQDKKIKVLEKIAEINFDGKNIGITHFPETAKEMSESGKYDLVFYGHTHKPCLARRSFSEGGGRRECLLANPGELAGQIFKPTFAVYDTEKDLLELKILEKL